MPTNIPDNFKPDAWMHEFGWRVEGLVATHERRDSFRDLIDDCHMRDWIRHFQSKAWERRRKWHERNAWSSERLKDEEAGPPPKHLSAGHSDWAIDHCSLDGHHFWAWMPCEYTLDNKPDTSLPLPFKNRELTVWEECAIVSALHDCVCENVKPLVLKQHSQSAGSGGVKLQDDFLALFRQIPKLTARDRPALEKCLADVCADMGVPTPAAQITETTNISVLLPSDAAGTTEDKDDPDDPAGEYIFRPGGDGWDLKFETERGHCGDSKGLQRICALLKTPNTTITGLALCDGDSRCETLTHSNAEAFDQLAFVDYNQKLEEYNEGIEEARKNSDEAQLAVWTEKKDELLAQIKRDTRLGGGSRLLGERSSAKSALHAAKESIRDVRKKLRKAELNSMADHLEQHVKTKESSLVYRPPSPAPNWTF